MHRCIQRTRTAPQSLRLLRRSKRTFCPLFAVCKSESIKLARFQKKKTKKNKEKPQRFSKSPIRWNSAEGCASPTIERLANARVCSRVAERIGDDERGKLRCWMACVPIERKRNKIIKSRGEVLSARASRTAGRIYFILK